MWINPQTEQVFRSHSAIREAFPDTSLPAALTDEILSESLGILPVFQAAKPNHTPATQSADELDPVIVGGVWTQQWSIRLMTSEEISAQQLEYWAAIQALRDSKTQRGGFPAAGKWFHSDVFSRTQQIGLTLMGAGLPAGLQWKTMDGSFVTMTPTLAGQIFASAAQQDAAMFAHAEALRAAVNAAPDPASVDITAGWPATFSNP